LYQSAGINFHALRADDMTCLDSKRPSSLAEAGRGGFKRLFERLEAVALAWLVSVAPAAAQSTVASNPVVQSGNASVTGLGTPNVTVNQATQLAAINWTSLGNNAGDVLRFVQPSASAVALNRVVGADPSHFLGSLIANGSVIVINPNGVFFGPGSQVNVNGLIASTLNITDSNFLSGRYVFEGLSSAGMVKNEGQITAGPNGVYLLAPNVTNNGIITSPGGQIALGAGTTAYLSDRPDGRGFLLEVKAPAGDVLNLKTLVADGGQVSMIGRLVTQSGLVQANSVRQQNGKIELVAGERAALTAGSVTRAAGDAHGVSDGGTILVKSDLSSGRTKFEQGAVIDVSGGVNGGNGGFAELSAASVTMGGRFLAHAASGYRGGRFLIDPTVESQTVTTADLAGFSGSGATDVEFRSPAGTDLTVSASYNLMPVIDPTTGTVQSGWALPSGQEGFLRFTAGNDLIFSPTGNLQTIQNGANSGPNPGVSPAKWNYVLSAGNDIRFTNTRLFTGGGGNLTLNAGRDIKLVPDTGGGHTILQTFSGNMSIVAGRDLIAPSAYQQGVPVPNGSNYSGIRLDGTGNLDITTGRDFLGGTVNGALTAPGFLLSDGTARINVGRDLGSPTNYAGITLGTSFVDSSAQTSRLGLTTVALTVRNNAYMGFIQDRGLVDRIPGQFLADPVTANPLSSVRLVSQQGNIYLKPLTSADLLSGGDVRRIVYPASFSALAPSGNIFIERLVQFWPSPAGTIRVVAGQSIVGTTDQGDPSGLSLCSLICGLTQDPPPHNPVVVDVRAETGDISGLKLDLTGSYRKIVTVSAGNNIRNIFGILDVPDVGRDAAGNQIPAVSITAKGDIDFSGQQGADSGFIFGGTGLARVTAGGSLDLAHSEGLKFRFDSQKATNDANKGGLLEIAVGRDVKMTESRIYTYNGASVFIHGLNAQTLAAGTTAIAASATLGVVTIGNQQVLAINDIPIKGQDGVSLIPVNSNNQPLIGKPVYLAGDRAVLDVTGSPVIVGAKDTIVGQDVLLVAGAPVLGVNGKPIVVDPTASTVVSGGDLVHGTAVLDRQLVRMADGTVLLVTNGKAVSSLSPGSAPVDGRPSVNNGVVTLAVDGKQVRLMEPVNGTVNVGTNSNTVGDETGIVTVRGGAIDVKSIGSINVNLSRIATLGGDNITLTSTTSDINAGSGSRNDVTMFPIEETNADGSTTTTFFAVPGSGIFTFHPKDGNLPNIPPFNPLSPFEEQVALHQFFGHDVSSLLPMVPAAHEAWINQYTESVQQLFAGFQLGDITLKAAHDVIVPPAGIRGRYITIEAGRNLDLQGGQIQGITNVTAGGQVVGSLSSFVGVFAVNLGGVSGGAPPSQIGLGSIGGSIGTVTTNPAVTASMATTSITATKAADDSKVFEPVNRPKTVADRSGKNGGLGDGTSSLRVRDKVRIKVETKSQ